MPYNGEDNNDYVDGEVVQHIEYVPIGEVFVEERNNIWNTPYLFNAKKFDEETGLYYYGARYYDPRLSLFMSVDRYKERYPNISSYTYCANNPIGNLDVNGDSIFVKVDKNLTLLYQNGKVFTQDGIEYTVNKKDKFLGQVVKALNKISSYESGKAGVNTLSDSKNNITIIIYSLHRFYTL